MKSPLPALGLLGLAIVGLWFFSGGTQPDAHANEPRVGEPLTHENLSVYFIHGTDELPPGTKVLSLSEALERNLAVVHETGSVNTLAVENTSDEYELFIQSGDIVKGGRQDRIAKRDMLLPPKSGVVPMPANCVEHDRWTGRGKEDSRQFQSSTKRVVGNEIQIANVTGQQSAVWANVKSQQEKLSANVGKKVNSAESPSSLQLALESPELQAKIAEYENALQTAGESRGDIIGVVFAVNGEVTGAEVYGSNAIFRKAWPKLLNSAAIEAFGERNPNTTVLTPSAKDVERFLARAGEPTPLMEADNLPDDDPVVAAQREMVRLRRLVQENERGNRQDETFVFGSLNDAESIRQPITPGPPTVVARPPLPSPAPVRQPAVTTGAATNTGGTSDVINEVQEITPAPAHPRPPAQPTPTNPNGNRLNTNVNVNSSSLMVESRDPARQNAVIHRSYLKK